MLRNLCLRYEKFFLRVNLDQKLIIGKTKEIVLLLLLVIVHLYSLYHIKSYLLKLKIGKLAYWHQG